MITLLLFMACQKDTEGVPDDSDVTTEEGTNTTDSPTDDTEDTDTETTVTTPDEACPTENAAPLGPGTCVLQAPCAWSGESSSVYVGYAVGAGDLNGDGLADVVIGAPFQDGEAGDASGAVHIMSGALVGVDADPTLGSLEGEDSTELFGQRLAVIGDVNGDDIADLLVGAPEDDENGEHSGEAYLIAGGDLTVLASWRGTSERSEVGGGGLGGGDFNGDGLTDVIVGGEQREPTETSETAGAGAIYVMYGQESGWATDGLVSDADATITPETTYDVLGRSVAVGDLDGDGLDDLIGGAPYGNSYRGRVFAMSGADVTGEVSALDIVARVNGENSYDTFGWSVGAGDLDGDGDDELIVGAPLADLSYPEAGAVIVYDGGPDIFTTGPTLLASWGGSFDDDQLGYSIATADVDGDGLEDLLSGGLYARAGLTTRAGRTDLFKGRTSDWPLAASALSSDASFHGGGVNDYLGTANAMGDINGDGKAEVIIGTGFANSSSAANVGSVYLFWGE